MKLFGFWALLVTLVLAGAAAAAEGDRAEARGDSRERSRADWREAMRARFEQAVKEFDKDSDGKLDDAERRAMFESFRERAAERSQRADGAPGDRDGRSRDSARRPMWPRPPFGQFGRGPWQFRRPESTRDDKAEESRDGARGRDHHARGHHARGHHRHGDHGDRRHLARGDRDRHHRGHHARGSGDRGRERRCPSADGARRARRPEGHRPHPERRRDGESERERPRA